MIARAGKNHQDQDRHKGDNPSHQKRTKVKRVTKATPKIKRERVLISFCKISRRAQVKIK